MRSKGPRRHKSELHLEYNIAQQTFDNHIPQIEREHHKKKLLDIQNVCPDNARDFCNHIKCLGPNKTIDISTRVVGNGAMQTDLKLFCINGNKTMKIFISPMWQMAVIHAIWKALQPLSVVSHFPKLGNNSINFKFTAQVLYEIFLRYLHKATSSSHDSVTTLR